MSPRQAQAAAPAGTITVITQSIVRVADRRHGCGTPICHGGTGAVDRESGGALTHDREPLLAARDLGNPRLSGLLDRGVRALLVGDVVVEYSPNIRVFEVPSVMLAMVSAPPAPATPALFAWPAGTVPI